MKQSYIRVSTLSVNLNVVMWAIAVIATIVISAKGSRVEGLFPILFGGVAVATYVLTSKPREKEQTTE